MSASVGGPPSPGGPDPSGGPPGRPAAPGDPPPGPRRTAPDPLGKRALFWAPGQPEAGDPGPASGSGHRPLDPAPEGARPLGKRALYSTARRGPGEEELHPGDPVAGRGPITVSCSSCGATSRVGLVDFLIFQLPVGFWLPRGRYGHRMTCPTCRRRAWVGVTLRRD